MARHRSLNVRSPFFIQLFTTQILVNCEVRLWKGDVVTDLPVDYTYLLTKEPTSNASTFEVAELARDFLAHSSSLTSGYCWMQVKLSDGNQTDVYETYLVSEGYTLYTEGLQSNAQTPVFDFIGLPSDNTPQQKSRIMVTESGTNVIPYLANPLDNTARTGTVSVTAGQVAVVGDGTLFTTEFTVGASITIAGENFTVATITNNLNLTLNIAHVAGASGVVIYTTYIDHSVEAINLANASISNDIIPQKTNSSQMIRNFVVTPSMSYVFFDFNGDGKEVRVDILRCSKYEAINLMYVNKYGMKTYFPFILKSIEKIKSSSDTFNRSLVDYNSLSSNSGLHASRKRITGTKQSFVLNTDWIAEYYVQQLEEVLLSEYVWLVKGTDNPIPVNITTSTMEKKTHVNDKLINYSIELETASNYINTVR
tara:strand:+ start:174 stop:1445 length:1272 start_codon:yes stop_codon:yes gene_type:complete